MTKVQFAIILIAIYLLIMAIIIISNNKKMSESKQELKKEEIEKIDEDIKNLSEKFPTDGIEQCILYIRQDENVIKTIFGGSPLGAIQMLVKLSMKNTQFKSVLYDVVTSLLIANKENKMFINNLEKHMNEESKKIIIPGKQG